MPTGIPSNIQSDAPDAGSPEDDDGPGEAPDPDLRTDSSDADDAESTPADDEARTRMRVVREPSELAGSPLPGVPVKEGV